MNSGKTAAFVTLGCKINQYESDSIREQVLGLGYREVDADSCADVYVVNTCAVTGSAGAKSRKAILRAARRNPAARIVVVGCSTAVEKSRIARIPQVALLAGNEEKNVVASFLDGGWRPGDSIPDRESDLGSIDLSRYRDRTRATIKVQDGCNSFCSFCVIPHLRGTSRSRHPDAIAEEAMRLAESGRLEIVISGIHLQDYGLDLEPRSSLVELLDRISSIRGLARLRLSSLGPRAFDSELLDLFARPVFCPHWHIPLQAGSNEVLRKMRRGYTVEEFGATLFELRRRFREPAITTDVIAGHPGETAALFEESSSVYRAFEFAKIHVFPFSFREGTLAAKLWAEHGVRSADLRHRVDRLLALDADGAEAYRRKWIGRRVHALIERSGDDDLFLEGRTDRGVRVRFEAPSPFARQRFPGTLQPARITRLGDDSVVGVWDGPIAGLRVGSTFDSELAP
jgi:threonylcarbamoyladenosine tRNA methylthiotransferase MtaB